MSKSLHTLMFIIACLLPFTVPLTAVALYDTENEKSEIKLGEKYPAVLVKCIDGDTAHFEINGQIYKTRFLYIDTPEYTDKVEPYGKEASVFTCNFLKTGEITIETDGESVFDRYGRVLAWVWVGDQLHQEEITKAGFVEDFYDYGDYLYEDRIVSAMEDAKKLSKGIYSSLEPPAVEASDETFGTANPLLDEKLKATADLAKISKIEKESSENTNSKGSTGSIISGLIVIGLLVFYYKKRKINHK